MEHWSKRKKLSMRELALASTRKPIITTIKKSFEEWLLENYRESFGLYCIKNKEERPNNEIQLFGIEELKRKWEESKNG